MTPPRGISKKAMQLYRETFAIEAQPYLEENYHVQWNYFYLFWCVENYHRIFRSSFGCNFPLK